MLGTRLSMSSTEIGTLPVLSFHGRIKMVLPNAADDEGEIRKLLDLDRTMRADDKQVLGFDTESKPSPLSSRERNRTALLQLSSDHACVLWRTTGQAPMPESLRRILEDGSILKVGQGIASDAEYLRSDFACLAGAPLRGFVDLFRMSTHLNCQPKSLQGLVGLFLRKRLLKDMRVSNWEDTCLRAEQIQYAALDAWASRAVYLAMKEEYSSSIWNEVEQAGILPEVIPEPPKIASAAVDFSKHRVMVTPPTPSLVASNGNPQLELVEYCVARGLKLRLGEVEKESMGQRVKCSFRVDFADGGESVMGCSKVAHSFMRDAQADAARELLIQLKRLQ